MRDALDEAHARQRIKYRAAPGDFTLQRRYADREAVLNRNVVIPVDAADLFDEIDLSGDVAAVAGDRAGDLSIRKCRVETEPLQHVAHVLIGDFYPEPLTASVGAHGRCGQFGR